jgi:GNAT superfamily N-acetyltransferase|tara:strand:- start:4969 stop:5424 length:456 start_codon:yes stop_codon:yes gene_type:complete
MIKISHECLSNIKEEIKPLLEKHWELVALNQGSIKLNPNWQEYARLDAAGILKIFTARSEGELVGYFVLMTSKSIHYQDHFFAINDVLFVLPDSRAGATGYKLVKFAENHCKENGVSLLMINTKVHIPFDNLMVGMGFDLIERIYSKFLGK